ncbi:hypothetical protein VLK31_31845 [Variovorax sp. H27-G14]|uniref:hypothetical protein n=1 Tax=Variovorax sp. H27-G14 TaxID=3111914 RepID=UPI0038FD1482
MLLTGLLSARFGSKPVILAGGFGLAVLLPLLSVATTPWALAIVLLAAPVHLVRMSGFLLTGLGASNIVPVLFRKAGAQTVMPSALAVGAITTSGYAGILVGPAGIGFVAHALGLHAAFWIVAALMCLVPLTAYLVAGDPRTLANDSSLPE